MKRLLFTLLLIMVMLSIPLATSCVRVDMTEKAGPITSHIYSFTDFTGIEVGHAFEVTITQSDNYSVNITAGENVFEHLNVYKNGSTLIIDVDTWFLTWFVSPKLTVTMPVLNELELSGACKGTVEGFRSSQDVKLYLSGASELDIDMETDDFFAELSGASEIAGRLIASHCEIELSGASRSSLTGSGGNIRIDGSGASNADMADFTVNNAYVEFSGASHGILDINGVLDVSLSGASLLEYKGNPILGGIDLSGASTVKQINSP
jgi:hypothetical protein